MKFIDYCHYLEKLETVASRNVKTEILSKLFADLVPQEASEALYLLGGKIGSKYENIEFNFSVKMVINSIEKLLIEQKNDKATNIREIYSEIGDIGQFCYEVREECFEFSSTKYELLEIYQKLKDIAFSSGKGSQMDKVNKFSELFITFSPLEAKYAARIIVGNLRLGMSEKTIIDALSWFKAGDKSLKKEIERALGIRSDIALIAEDILNTDVKEIKAKFDAYTVIPGVPVASKLVERERGVEAVFERIPDGYVQPKLDGLRAQIHKWTESGKVKVKIYSRNLEDITHMFPELIAACNDVKISSFVLDSEVVAYDFEKEKMLPFQETIQRKRKHNVDDVSKTIPVRSMIFDVLFYDGQDLTQLDLEERISKLDNFEKYTKCIKKLETVKFSTVDELDAFFRKALDLGLEGVIVKKNSTPYEAGTRNFDWIKLKASSQSELVDTIDAVVMGYYFGTGARSKFGLGAILVGVYNEEEDRYETVAKVGTGITDEQFVTIKQDLLGITQKEVDAKYLINKSVMPDKSIEPKIVVEIEADELTISKVHTACMDKLDGKGISMRFPRLKVWGRDKQPTQATNTKELLRIYELRKKK